MNFGVQCQKIPLGQLSIMFDLKIFINQTTNFTVIDTAISAWQGGQDIELFRRTNLILSGQKPFTDCIAEGGLIRPPFPEMCSPLTTEPPPRPITTTTATTSTAPLQGNNRAVHVAIGVSVAIVFAVIVIIAAIILIACYRQEIHNKWMKMKGGRDGHKEIKDPLNQNDSRKAEEYNHHH